MPQASDELRKLWHNKRVWQKLHWSVDRKTLGTICVPTIKRIKQEWTVKKHVWAIVWYAWTVNGDAAAERFLKRQGYREHRFMWYRPRFGQHAKNWKASRKEATALNYLCDEWDHSYDLRDTQTILDEERNKVVEFVDKAATSGQRLTAKSMVRALKHYEYMIRLLS